MPDTVNVLNAAGLLSAKWLGWSLSHQTTRELLSDSHFSPQLSLHVIVNTAQVLIRGLQIHFSQLVNLQTWNPRIMSSVHTVEYEVLSRRRNERLKHAPMWMDLGKTLLSERGQAHKISQCRIPPLG